MQIVVFNFMVPLIKSSASLGLCAFELFLVRTVLFFQSSYTQGGSNHIRHLLLKW